LAGQVFLSASLAVFVKFVVDKTQAGTPARQHRHKEHKVHGVAWYSTGFGMPIVISGKNPSSFTDNA